MRKTYNKLVRDKIPEIIAASGARARTKTLADTAYAGELMTKLQEEVNECVRRHNMYDEVRPDELADILEVVYALAALHDTTPEALETIRKSKADKRGAFTQKIFLIDVEE